MGGNLERSLRTNAGLVLSHVWSLEKNTVISNLRYALKFAADLQRYETIRAKRTSQMH